MTAARIQRLPHIDGKLHRALEPGEVGQCMYCNVVGHLTLDDRASNECVIRLRAALDEATTALDAAQQTADAWKSTANSRGDQLAALYRSALAMRSDLIARAVPTPASLDEISPYGDLPERARRYALVAWHAERGHDLRWALDWPGLPGIDPAVSLGVLEWSRARVQAGLPPATAAALAWADNKDPVHTHQRARRLTPASKGIREFVAVSYPTRGVWRCHVRPWMRPEDCVTLPTRDEAEAAMDARLHGWGVWCAGYSELQPSPQAGP